jgi:6,7-dimethyl-8-ribityllumazine synthase
VELEGASKSAGSRFAIVVSRFNAEVTEGLLRGARQALRDVAVSDADVTIVRVPGAFEIPVTALALAESGRFDAVIALGCLIKGDTVHFEYISAATSQGLMQASLTSRVPIAFGVLTALDDEQALARAGDNPDNKGREAAAAAVEMATLLRLLRPEAS